MPQSRAELKLELTGRTRGDEAGANVGNSENVAMADQIGDRVAWDSCDLWFQLLFKRVVAVP